MYTDLAVPAQQELQETVAYRKSHLALGEPLSASGKGKYNTISNTAAHYPDSHTPARASTLSV